MIAILLLAFSPQEPAPTDTWSWRAAPYLWATNIDGSARIGSTGVDFSADFGDLVENMDGAGLVFVEARKGRLSLLGDFVFLGLEQDGQRQSGIPTSGELDTTIVQVASLYRVSETSPLEFGGGARWTQMDSELTVGAATASEDIDVLDGFMAARASWMLADRWSLTFYGDLGAGDSDLTWQASGLLGFRLAKWCSAELGYRMLDYDFESSVSELDLTFEGMLLGVTFWF
jgi:hypothetical protein